MIQERGGGVDVFSNIWNIMFADVEAVNAAFKNLTQRRLKRIQATFGVKVSK